MAKANNTALLRALIGDGFTKDSKILDFGCGYGESVYYLLDQGYRNVSGYDVQDRVKLRDEADRKRFHIAQRTDARLPFDDDTFDLIISDQVMEHVQDQVTVLKELHRITKPGGHHFHIIPSPYYPIERHINVPFGNLLTHRWWFKLWAILGVRNRFQHGMTAEQVANHNAFYVVEALNYVPTSCYKVVWHRLGFGFKFAEQQMFDIHRRAEIRMIGRINRRLPLFGWCYRTFKNRHVLLTKL